MSEFMGLVYGAYDAKPTHFAPGGASLHNCMSAQGPDADAFEHGCSSRLEPARCEGTLAFMFESRLVIRPTRFALETPHRQGDYLGCWNRLESRFQR